MDAVYNVAHVAVGLTEV